MHWVLPPVAYKVQHPDAAIALDLGVRNALTGFDSNNRYYVFGHEWLHKTRAIKRQIARLDSRIARTPAINAYRLSKMRTRRRRLFKRLHGVTKSYHYLYIRCGSKGVWGGGSSETRSDNEES